MDVAWPLLAAGFHALAVYRVANALWESGSTANKGAALMLQSRASELFAVDIHPGHLRYLRYLRHLHYLCHLHYLRHLLHDPFSRYFRCFRYSLLTWIPGRGPLGAAAICSAELD